MDPMFKGHVRFVRNCWCCRSMQGERWVPAPGSNPDNPSAPLGYHRPYNPSSVNELNQYKGKQFLRKFCILFSEFALLYNEIE